MNGLDTEILDGIPGRVAAGVTLLDNESPDWWERINAEKLDIGTCGRCALGQLYGDYGLGVGLLGLTCRGQIDFGFYAATDTIAEFQALTAEWRRQITALRAERAELVAA